MLSECLCPSVDAPNPITPLRVFRHAVFPVFPRRNSAQPPKMPVEIRQIPEPRRETDLRHRTAGMQQHPRRLADPKFHHVGHECPSSSSRKIPAEG